MSTTKERLALSIIDFLSASLKDGTLSHEDAESVEVAQSCIADCFKVDAAKATTSKQSLLQIYTEHEKNSSGTGSSSSTKGAPSEQQKKEAEGLKSKGNASMAGKDYTSAIDYYTQALALVPGNPIFLSNRAAAYSAAKDHESARADAEAATIADPKYTKGWSRLGLARFALGDAQGAVEAYERGIDEEGNGGSEAMRKGFETAKRRVEELAAEGNDAGDDVARGGAGGGAGGMPDLSSLAGMFGGGGGGGGGGMPDLSAIMNNPMMASMAQKLISDPNAMASLMNNPRLREMAGQFGGGGGGASGGAGGAGRGGGMPDLSSLMSDPSIAAL